MPLLNGVAYVPSLALPENIKAGDEVFHIKLTGEIVKDYEDYLAKARLYRQKQWACSETGRCSSKHDSQVKQRSHPGSLCILYTGTVNLTYFQALYSEEQAITSKFKVIHGLDVQSDC
jgi:hypothetical protein